MEATMTTRKRGRPAKPKTLEQSVHQNQSHWDKTPQERKMSLGLVYLTLNTRGLSMNDTQKKEYLKKIKETPVEEFSNTGWDVYKNILGSIIPNH